ncbi:hypothetical protein B9Z51_11550 [Limnohabitans sp. T6-5]|uniref:glycosyltransferase family 25 protein n=1 Tax=Limnohabitans sp. T6-5 TaxID=1100724 RepID=UPI000DD29658|nr:glycosyltransferase family 25 protein [Limnohabitans sp. T6-5]PUE09486.1 hypothetical protein B9Z51_11550 [Limnohabitans sp. T6-5]
MYLEKFLILVINLDRAPQRLEKIKLQLDRLGLPWERLLASDGQQLDMADPSLFDNKTFAIRHGKTALAGEIGCYLSHARALERLLSSEAQYAVILEDDVLLQDDLPDVLIALDKRSLDWDMVKLSGIHRGHPLSLGKLTDQHELTVMMSRYTGASAYIVNKRAAQIYVQGLLPMRIPYDHEFDRGWHWALKIRAVLPTPCVHDQVVQSTIESPANNRLKFVWYKRLPTLGWRIGNDCRRCIYAMKAWFRIKFI